MCVPRKQGKKICACGTPPEAGPAETFCCSVEKITSLEERLAAIERRMDRST